MAFTLNEAVVKIRTEGLDTLERDLKRTDTSLKRLGRGSSVKGLNADVRNTTRSVKNLGETAGRVGNLLAVMPGAGLRVYPHSQADSAQRQPQWAD